MALSYTSPIFQQVNTPALDMRRFLGVGLQEGVVGVNDLAVAQRGAGANMSVDVAAGEALIQGDTVTNQGRYYVLNDAITNVTGFAAANATNPRIDRVTLRVRDQFHGDAANDISFQIVTGTATSGATLTNLSGAAAVPNSQLLLANVLIPANATTITTGNIDTTVRQSINISWQNYTPAWTNLSGTNPVLSNGTLVGRYFQRGKFVQAEISLTMGSSTTYGSGGSGYQMSFPPGLTPAFAANAALHVFQGGVGFDTSTGSQQYWLGWRADTNIVYANTSIAGSVQSGIVGPTAPFTWATGDLLTLSATYEAA